MFILQVVVELFFLSSLKKLLYLCSLVETTLGNSQAHLEFAIENCQQRSFKEIHKITVNIIF